MQLLRYSAYAMRDIPRLKAEFFKALGHPLRIRVLELLSEGDQSVSELLEHVSVEQPYLSQQLAVLRRAGFVVARRDGSNVIYALADPRVAELLSVSRQMLLDMVTATRDELSQA
jgi:DNA-binding transcriptional ArsR family regulator